MISLNHLLERLYEYVLKPRNQLQHVHVWTSIICKYLKHVFKMAINWKQQSINTRICENAPRTTQADDFGAMECDGL